MLVNKLLARYAQKLIYFFLVIWVGGLAPLIYFENYSSHRDVQSVQISLLKEPGAGKLPAALRQLWAHRIQPKPFVGLIVQPQWVARNILLPGINSSVTILHDGYLFSVAGIASFFDASPTGRVSTIQPIGQSVWLPPPEKPPPFPVL